jgi:hypothetical protein
MNDDDNPYRGWPDSDTVTCSVCRQLGLDGPEAQEFVVDPSRGGGWHVWAAALLRHLDRIGHQPTQVVIITQPLKTQRYVQVMIGHGVALAEASGSDYLAAPFQLSASEESLLATLGWGVDGGGGRNWQLPLVHGNWGDLVEILLATMVGILGFSEHRPVHVSTFGCDAPCRDCSWPDQPGAR